MAERGRPTADGVATGGGAWPDASPSSGQHGEMPVEERVAARVILLDPADRVLLLHGFEPASPSVTWWFTPGGGVEPGESLEQTARRELVEETGIAAFDLGPVIWRRHSVFTFAGRRWRNDEWYYLGRTEVTVFDTSGQTDLERATTTGLRWWSSADLQRTSDTVYPLGLGTLLDRLLREGPPSVPLVLDSQDE